VDLVADLSASRLDVDAVFGLLGPSTAVATAAGNPVAGMTTRSSCEPRRTDLSSGATGMGVGARNLEESSRVHAHRL